MRVTCCAYVRYLEPARVTGTRYCYLVFDNACSVVNADADASRCFVGQHTRTRAYSVLPPLGTLIPHGPDPTRRGPRLFLPPADRSVALGVPSVSVAIFAWYSVPRVGVPGTWYVRMHVSRLSPFDCALVSRLGDVSEALPGMMQERR